MKKHIAIIMGTALLAAGINHEICNPLGIVRGQCEMFLLNNRDGLYANKSADEVLRISAEVMNKVIKMVAFTIAPAGIRINSVSVA